MKISKLQLTLLVVLYLFASSIRLIINYSTEFIPGANGAFYLANVRSILETGEILFKDFPLIFWLESLLAKCLITFGFSKLETAVDLACRLFDSFIPPLVIIPAFFLVERLNTNKENKFIAVYFTSLTVLFISFMMLVSDFQKNSLGLIWLFSLMLWINKILEEKKVVNYIFSFLFLALAGITHFGCFLVAVLYIVLVLLVNNFIKKRFNLRFDFLVGLLLVAVYLVINLISPPRLKATFDFLENVFRYPVIILYLQGKPVLSAIDLFTLIFINLIAIFATVYYLKNNKSLSNTNRIFVLSAIVLTIILASPFIGVEWSQRLTFISYVPAIILVPFIFGKIKTGPSRKLFLAIIAIVILSSVIVRINLPVFSNMNRGMLNELYSFKNQLPKEGNFLVVSRHGLEWWINYILRTPVVKESALEKVYWERFRYMFFIIQKKDKPPFGPIGIFGPPFREPILPPNSILFFEGIYFDVYWSKTSPSDMTIFIESHELSFN